MHWHDGMWGLGGSWLAMLLMLALWGLVLAGIVVGIIALVRWASSQGGGGTTAGPGETPLDILKARYARGEITREQFHDMKRDIAGETHTPRGG